MSNDVANSNVSLPKEHLAEYVKNVAKLEVDIYTLDKSIKKCEVQRKNALQSAKNSFNEANNELSEVSDRIDSLKNTEYVPPKKPVKKSLSLSEYIGVYFEAIIITIFKIFLLIIVPLIVLRIAKGILGDDLIYKFLGKFIGFIGLSVNENGNIQVSTLAGLVAIIVLLRTIYNRYRKADQYNRNSYKEACDSFPELEKNHRENFDRLYENALNDLNNEFRQKESNLIKAQQRLDAATKHFNLTGLEISEAKNNYNLMCSNLQKIYDLNIIPPDYRKIDCMLIINDYFRNDLVDTIREAILMYRDQIFKKEIVSGIMNINASLSSISMTMQNISRTLKDIANQVDYMSLDMSKMQNDFELTRYATESINESNSKLAYYEDLRYARKF